MTSHPRFVAHSTVHRAAYTLVELTIAMSLGTVLVAGLASALLISAEGYRGNHGAQKRSTAAQVQADILSDLQQATSFTTKTATSIAFKVPDRSGDSKEELIAYDWNSGTKTLTYSYGGGTAQTLLTDVTAFNIDFLTRSYSGTYPALPSLDPNIWGTRFGGEVIFEGFTEAKASSGTTSISVNRPSGTKAGDLLIAAVAICGDKTGSLPTPSGWTLVTAQQAYAKVTLGVWRKIATSEPSSYSFSWGGNDEAYGWIMRFSGHNPSAPINAWAKRATDNVTTTPPSPAVTTTVNNALILRLAGIYQNKITVNSPGLAGHAPITMDYSSTHKNSASGGAGYVVQAAAGTSGGSTFALTDERETIAITVAIAPN